MALTKKGEFWYGTTSGDTQAELRSYSIANLHEAVRFASSKCDCGCRTFALQTDEAVSYTHLTLPTTPYV